MRDAIRVAAARAGQPVSTWLARAAEAQLRNEAFDEFFAAWQAEYGVISDAAIAAAEEELGLRRRGAA